MKKTIRKITEWRNTFEVRLRERLEALTPKTRLIVILTLFSLFAVCCLVMLGTAVSDFGKGKREMRMEHIEKLELPSRERHNPALDYGTENHDCETDKSNAYETE